MSAIAGGGDDYDCHRRRTQTLKSAHIYLLSAKCIKTIIRKVGEHDGLLEQLPREMFGF